MPETACLHLQTRDTDPVRVIELTGVLVRVGRASFCEVRLQDPELSDEVCHLRRRGASWHLVPTAGPSVISVEGRPVEKPRLLPYGVSFRVGKCWLTLRPSLASPPEWGSVQGTATPAGSFAAETPSEALRAEPYRPASTPSRPEARATFLSEDDARGAETDHLSGWKTRRPRREGRMHAAQDDQPWEARWRALGEKLRSGAGASSAASAPLRPPAEWDNAAGSRPEPQQPRPTARRQAPADPKAAPPAATPPDYPAVSTIESPLGAVVPEHTAPRPGIAPAAHSIVPFRPQPDDQLTSREYTPVAPAASHFNPVPPAHALSANPSDLIDPGAFDRTPTASPSMRSDGRPVSAPVSMPEDVCDSAAASSEPPLFAVDGKGRGFARTRLAGDVVFPDFEAAPASPTTDHLGATPGPEAPATVAQPIQSQRCFIVNPLPAEAAQTLTDDGQARRDSWRPGPAQDEASASPRGAAAHGSQRTSAQATAPSQDWPSAHDILSLHKAIRQPVETKASARRPSAAPVVSALPTVEQPPRHWSLPLWLGWLPLVLFTMMAGVIGIALTWTWSLEAQGAGRAGDILSKSRLGPKDTLDPTLAPGMPWWQSTPASLARWAAALARMPGDNNQLEARTFLDSSMTGSPFEGSARYALARAESPNRGPAPLARSLGLTRDVVSLTWSGHQLVKAGKREPALNAYRSALAIACTAELPRLGTPGLLEEDRGARFTLPGESLFALVVRDMISHTEWTFRDWSPALPESAVPWIVAARLLRENARADSDAALDAVVKRATGSPPQGMDAAIQLAAIAEAHAIRADWTNAEARYKEAIDRMPIDIVRRSWWYNLADVERHLNNDRKRQEALEAAKSIAASDEISRRALDALKGSGYRSSLTAARTKDSSKATQASP